MNCPTCGCGTLKKVAVLETDPSEFVWCPMCGTLATGPGVGLPPELIGRCLEFEAGNLHTQDDGRRDERWFHDVGRYLRSNTKAPGGTPP